MALVKCNDCGNKIASSAIICPQCGSSTPQGYYSNNSTGNSSSTEGIFSFILVIILILILIAAGPLQWLVELF